MKNSKKYEINYLKDYLDSIDNLIFNFAFVITHGNKLIKKYQESFVEIRAVTKELIELDGELCILSQLLLSSMEVFAYRWNESFKANFFDKNDDLGRSIWKNKDNWFFYVSELNNLHKHQDSLKEFYPGKINDENFKHTPFLKNPNKYKSGSRQIYIFNKTVQDYIDCFIIARHAENVANGFNPIKEIFKIDSAEEYIKIQNKFLPNYKAYLNWNWHILKIAYKGNFNKFLEDVNKLPVRKDFFVNIRRNWKKYSLKLTNLIKFLKFIYLMMYKTNSFGKDLFDKTEIKQHVTDLWSWYENTYDEHKETLESGLDKLLTDTLI